MSERPACGCNMQQRCKVAADKCAVEPYGETRFADLRLLVTVGAARLQSILCGLSRPLRLPRWQSVFYSEWWHPLLTCGVGKRLPPSNDLGRMCECGEEDHRVFAPLSPLPSQKREQWQKWVFVRNISAELLSTGTCQWGNSGKRRTQRKTEGVETRGDSPRRSQRDKSPPVRLSSFCYCCPPRARLLGLLHNAGPLWAVHQWQSCHIKLESFLRKLQPLRLGHTCHERHV